MANDNLTLHQVIAEAKSAEITKQQDQIVQSNPTAANLVSNNRHYLREIWGEFADMRCIQLACHVLVHNLALFKPTSQNISLK